MNKITETKIAKMVRWMATHEDEVAKIIDMDIGLSNQDCLNLIIELEQCEQYELIVAFLHAGRFIEPVATIGSNFWRRLADYRNDGRHRTVKRNNQGPDTVRK